MKKILINALVSVFLLGIIVACDNNYKGEGGFSPQTYLNSYISQFIQCDKIEVTANSGFVIDEKNKWYYHGGDDNSLEGIVIALWGDRTADKSGYPTNIFYPVPQIGSTGFLFSNGDDPNDPYYLERQAGYDKYIEEVGDTTYNRTGYHVGCTVSCIPLKNVIITADKSFADNYPAGTDLSAFFSIIFDDVYATIKNGYAPVADSYQPKSDTYDPVNNATSYRYSKLSEISLEKYLFTRAFWDLFLHDKPQQTDTYIFSVTMEFVDGTVLEGEAPPIKIKGED